MLRLSQGRALKYIRASTTLRHVTPYNISESTVPSMELTEVKTRFFCIVTTIGPKFSDFKSDPRPFI